MEEGKLGLITESLRTSFRHLIDRCEKARIEYLLERAPTLKKHIILYIHLPSGKDKRTLRLVDLGDAQKLNQVEFEKYVFLPRYQAICSYEDGLIEAYIQPLGPFVVEYAFYRLLNIPYDKLQKIKRDDLAFVLKDRAHKGGHISITISKPTDTMLALAARESHESGMTLKIRGLEISNTKEAVAILDKLAKSLFFEIEASLGIPLMLELYHKPDTLLPGIFSKWLISRRKGKRLLKFQEPPIVFPKYEYDVDPLNLYLYAASADEMPLLQFLAYYQVLEFYFPIYSQQEVQAEVANIIKDPEFDPNDHLDINKVISAILSKIGKGYVHEKAQMRSTVRGCTRDRELRELLKLDPVIKRYFQSDYKKLSPLKVNTDNQDSNLTEQLADRLYDIRCRIVHTKADLGDRESILPFTEEASLLWVESTIIGFIAYKALLSNRKKLKL